MEIRVTLKDRLRSLRAERGETQAQIAQDLGISFQHYQKFERGENLPSLEKFMDLAKHFGVSLDYLAGWTEERRK